MSPILDSLAAILLALLAGACVGWLTGMILEGLGVHSLLGFLIAVTGGFWVIGPAFRLAMKRLGQN